MYCRSHFFERMILQCLLLASSVACLSSRVCIAGSKDLSIAAESVAGVQAHLVFDGAEIAGQKMRSYRLVTSLSPERLLADFESLWSTNDKAKVWRSRTNTWEILSRVKHFPEIEVLQVRRGAGGETIARMSIGSPLPQIAPRGMVSFTHWLPTQSRVLQSFNSSDPGRRAHLMIARCSGSLQVASDWIERQAQREGFKLNQQFKLSPEQSNSRVAMLSRGSEEVVLTLDRAQEGVTVVLQHSEGRR